MQLHSGRSSYVTAHTIDQPFVLASKQLGQDFHQQAVHQGRMRRRLGAGSIAASGTLCGEVYDRLPTAGFIHIRGHAWSFIRGTCNLSRIPFFPLKTAPRSIFPNCSSTRKVEKYSRDGTPA